jgi:hypothetical protein
MKIFWRFRHRQQTQDEPRSACQSTVFTRPRSAWFSTQGLILPTPAAGLIRNTTVELPGSPWVLLIALGVCPALGHFVNALGDLNIALG